MALAITFCEAEIDSAGLGQGNGLLKSCLDLRHHSFFGELTANDFQARFSHLLSSVCSSEQKRFQIFAQCTYVARLE